MVARYTSAFETARLLDERDVELVMITITPPGIVTEDHWGTWEAPNDPPKAAKMYMDDEPVNLRTWREAYIWLRSKMCKTAWWHELGILGGIWAYEGKHREPGEWISCKRPQCKGKYPEGVQCDGIGHKGGKPYGRYAGTGESHPHLHILADRLVGRGYLTDKEATERITQYTKANGFGYAKIDKNHDGNTVKGVAYATKYVMKDGPAREGGRTRGVFGYLCGAMTKNDSTKRAFRDYQ